jgi:hypothetical protein
MILTLTKAIFEIDFLNLLLKFSDKNLQEKYILDFSKLYFFRI